MRTKLVRRTFFVLMALMLFAGGAIAADISGKWTAPATSPSGTPQGDRIFTFKVTGNKVTGTVITQRTVNATFEVEGQPKMVGKLTTQSGSPAEISEGKITGNEVSFVTVSRMGPMEMKTNYTGKISGNEIAFTSEVQLPEDFTPPSGPSGPGGQGPPPAQEFVAKKLSQ